MNKIEIKNLSPKNIISKVKNSKKRMSKKKMVMLIVAILVIVGIAFKMFFSKPPNVQAQNTILNKANIVNSINVLGEVKSGNSTNVYTNSGNIVKEVKVKVGDEVKTGDVLAILDTEKLKEEIEQLTETLSASEANGKLDLDSKKRAYDNIVYINENNLNTDLINANSMLETAKMTLEDAERLYQYNKTILGYGEISNQEFKKSENDYNKAKDDYNKANVELENSKLKIQEDLKNAQNSYESAKIAYENKSERVALENKKKELDECTIKASVDGTITTVNATVGNPSTGTLFKIEDLNNLVIKASIKEVDIANIKVGQKTIIKTDATDDLELLGEISEISPTAKVDEPTVATGNSTSNSGDVIFEAKVKINEMNENIKIGMKAKLNIILEEKNDVYAIPHESIIENENGLSIYVAEAQEDNKYIIKEVAINKGMESDFNVEIYGDELQDGMKVLSEPSNYTVGSIVELGGGMAEPVGGEVIEQ
ncbi:HlyD family secretion protein [Clostridium aquiflavi]|uniref:Efflux RND transporter periplasmic adaptor subunit n=1 Tax=Clostridium aquiflavi TaxID=3073603 RepID=A0ABU1EKR4_9CLOT|nr:efflux RND transporter periplasmic adaptor subunit [Clostridium sp. 5N-1]MDR5588838.1 efflux RND transporter periplasmic adaptor subunit [Clostridium sp. 5N-1]